MLKQDALVDPAKMRVSTLVEAFKVTQRRMHDPMLVEPMEQKLMDKIQRGQRRKTAYE